MDFLVDYLVSFYSLSLLNKMVKTQLTSDQRVAVLLALAKGRLQTEVAGEFNVSRRTIYNIRDKWEKASTTRRATYCRMRKLGPEKTRLLVDYVKRNSFDTLKEIKQNLNLPVSLPTISRHLKEKNLSCYTSIAE